MFQACQKLAEISDMFIIILTFIFRIYNTFITLLLMFTIKNYNLKTCCQSSKDLRIIDVMFQFRSIYFCIDIVGMDNPLLCGRAFLNLSFSSLNNINVFLYVLMMKNYFIFFQLFLLCVCDIFIVTFLCCVFIFLLVS